MKINIGDQIEKWVNFDKLPDFFKIVLFLFAILSFQVASAMIFGVENFIYWSGIFFLTSITSIISHDPYSFNDTDTQKIFKGVILWPLFIGLVMLLHCGIHWLAAITFYTIGLAGWMIAWLFIIITPEHKGEWWLKRAWYDLKSDIMTKKAHKIKNKAEKIRINSLTKTKEMEDNAKSILEEVDRM